MSYIDNKIFILETESIEIAQQKLENSYQNCLIVQNNSNQIIGTLTNGDIRRFLIKKPNLKSKIKNVCNRHYIFLKKETKASNIKKILLKKQVPLIPLIQKKKVIKCYFFQDYFKKKLREYRALSNKVDAVIMAGGLGSRLLPFSDVLPKPLIPIGKKTAIDHIIENFLDLKVNNIFLTLNYKKNIIKSYILDQYSKNKQIKFINEKKRLGTAASLKLIQKKTNRDLFVSNCDTLVKFNLEDLLFYHYEENNDLTLVAAIKDFKIPYGVCIADKNNLLKKINEKPSIKILANVGTYILDKKVINIIPNNQYYDMNELITNLQKKKKKVGIYPINEDDWFDVGDWENLNKSQKKI